MKASIHRISALCLALLLLLCAIPLASCNKASFQEPLTSYAFVKETMLETLRVENPLTEEEQILLLRYLEGKEWINEPCKGTHNYELKNDSLTLYYGPECGTVYDQARDRSIFLSEEGRQAVNELLRVNAERTPAPSLDESGDSITVYYYPTFSGEMGSRTVYGSLATALIAELSASTETGEIIPAPHEDQPVLPPPRNEAPRDMRNHYWILVGDKMYRLCSEYSNVTLCAVESYAGEGKVLTLTEEFKTLIFEAWRYYPKETHKGTYYRSTGELTMTQVFKGVSTVRFEIQELTFGTEKDDPATLTLTVDSDEEQVIYFDFWYWSGSDVIVGMASSNVYLNGTEPTTVTVDFKTDPKFGTQIKLVMGQTQAIISIRKEP